MSEIKHTPGPWHAILTRAGFYIQAEYHVIVDTADQNGWYGTIDSEANARLIAAAPELLGALEYMLSGWRYIQQDPKHREIYGVGWERAQRLAEAAIAKAKGEQP